MKILVTGINGQLGHDVMICLAGRNIEGIGADLEQFDITNEEQTKQFIKEAAPDAVIHCSAYTAVDKGEDEYELCRSVNEEGSRNIAKVCKELHIKMMYISTDYVFPGTGDAFYETDDMTGPLGAYGKTKLLGEQAVREQLSDFFIVRISWVFGANGANFVKTMLHLGQTKEVLRVVGDQIGSPTYTKDLAELLCDMIVTEKYGVYHATNEGICSFAEFAEEIFRQAGFSARVEAITTEEYGAKAARPKNSRLSKSSLDVNGFPRLPDWKDALKRFLEELSENKEG